MRDLVVVSWNEHNINDGVNYVAGFSTGQEWGLPPVAARQVKRTAAWPVVAGVERQGRILNLVIQITGTDVRSLRDQLLRWFDPEDDEPKRLVVKDEGDETGQTRRYVMAICERIEPLPVGSNAAADTFLATLVVHGDPRWRAITAVTDIWNITASGQTRTITNPGSDDAYPIIKIKPTSAKTGGYAYRRFVAVVWRLDNAATDYPLCAELDTQALIGAGKMQADEDDLRVIVDGVEVDRWLHGIGTTSTKVWFLLNFQPQVEMTLKTAIPSSGAITSIEVNEDIERMPTSGLLMIDSEVFVYTAKDNAERKFTGVTRAAKGTSEAAHTAGATVHWLQHEIWLAYGNDSVTAPAVDDARKPMFDLASSTNATWIYIEFGDSEERRAGRWSRWGQLTLSGRGGCYTITERGGTSSPYAVAGAWLSERHGNAYGWYLYNPCGIVNVTWTGGKKRRADSNFLVHCMNWPRGASWWDWHYNPTSPASASVWESWSYSGPDFDVSDTVAIAAYFYPQDVEVDGATVSLYDSETPTVSVGSELGNYSLEATITNTTTGDSFSVSLVMSLNQEIEIDCYNRTVTLLADGSKQLAALTIPTSQRHWLRLAPGDNELRFDDAGTAGVTVTVEFEPRYY